MSLNEPQMPLNKYSRVSFCDGLFYDDSLLRPLLSQNEHSRLVRHLQIKRTFSAKCALFQCAHVSSFSILVQIF